LLPRLCASRAGEIARLVSSHVERHRGRVNNRTRVEFHDQVSQPQRSGKYVRS
jgi:hypothetical protein